LPTSLVFYLTVEYMESFYAGIAAALRPFRL
jgi:hypothetical protein